MTSRRQFIQSAAVGVAAFSYHCRTHATESQIIDRSFEHGRPLREFEYGQVSFRPGLHEAQLDHTHSVLMSLSEDSMLRPYRLRAGIAAPGCDLGGWYSSDEHCAECLGQWLSALSRFYAITQDEATVAKVDRLIQALSLTIEPSGKVYGEPAVAPGPAYNFDKLVCGLMDAHYLAKHPTALDVLERATDAALPRLPGKAIDFNLTDGGAHESYTIPENQFITWQRGGSVRHLELAQQYLNHAFFEPLAEGENVLPGRHAYSHVNSLCSAVKAYLVLGNPKYLRAARNGFAFVEAQSFATGGWGPSEFFLPFAGSASLGLVPIHSLGDSLIRTRASFETPCGAYAHFKLTRYLLRITQDSKYGDSMERIMYNTVLGAKSLRSNGRAFYYSDYGSNGHKTYYAGMGESYGPEWPCCSGTITQIAADYRISTYFSAPDGIYVNLYIPSTLKWQQNGSDLSLTQVGSYPLSDVTSMTIDTATPTIFALRLRIPAWATRPSISINGSRIKTAIQPGTFAVIKREWRGGDHVEVELPRNLELKAIAPASPNTVAMVYGPVVLFALCDETPVLTRKQLLAAERQGQEGAEWHVKTAAGPLRFIPFWLINDERYCTYSSAT